MAGNHTAKLVAQLVKPYVEELGLKLWDVRFVKEGVSWYLRIYIDKEGGVTIDDCTDVSHAVDPVLDREDPISVSYYLEVCSPGLERELTEDWHFEKYKGEKVLIKLIRPRDKKREFKGTLMSYDGTVTALCDGEELTFEQKELVCVKLDDAEF